MVVMGDSKDGAGMHPVKIHEVQGDEVPSHCARGVVMFGR